MIGGVANGAGQVNFDYGKRYISWVICWLLISLLLCSN